MDRVDTQYVFRRNLPKVIKKILKDKDIPVSDLCKTWDIGKELVEKYLRGTYDLPIYHFYSFCRAYNVSPSKIFNYLSKKL